MQPPLQLEAVSPTAARPNDSVSRPGSPNMPPMLPALQDPKLLSQVFDVIENGIGSSKRDLLWAALACTAFRDPALDALWRSLDTILPLLKLLSFFKLSNGVYAFCGAFQSQDWDRFDAYARKVKEFTVKHGDLGLAPSVYIQLAQLRPQPFPALELFRCPSVTPLLSHLSLFVSPTLLGVELDGCAPDNIHVIDPFLCSLISNPRYSSPHLTHLVLQGNAATVNAPLFLFSTLRSLNMEGEVGLATLDQIGMIQQLESLVITVSPSVTVLKGAVGFPRLKTLHITGASSLIHSMLELVTTVQMERVSLVISVTHSAATETPKKVSMKKLKKGNRMEMNGGRQVKEEISGGEAAQPRGDWASCIAMLSSRWSASLISITLSLSNLTQSRERIPPGLFSDIPPFPKVEHVQLTDCHFQPSDGEIRELALAFPELRALHLSVMDCVLGGGSEVEDVQTCQCSKLHSDHVVIDQPGYLNSDYSIPGAMSPRAASPLQATTIEALWALADSCRHLKTLEIGLDLSYIPPFSPSTVCSHGLERLSVGSLFFRRSFSKRLKVGRHLNRLFPQLRHVETHEGYSADDWKEIYEIVQTFQDVRIDDKSRIAVDS